MTYDTFLTIMAFGLTGAGLVHSGWLWLGHTRPSFTSVLEDGAAFWMPFRVLAIMLAAPVILAGFTTRLMEHGWRYLGFFFAGLAVSCIWCFMNGIVLVVCLNLLMTA